MNKKLSTISSVCISILFYCCTSVQNKKDLSNYARKDSIPSYPKEYDSTIYLGNVLGNNADFYNHDNVYRRDTMYGLQSLTKSKYQIEIRFYTQNPWADTSYCTVLFYDTAFKINRVKHYLLYDTTRNSQADNSKSISKTIAVKTNPDSIFQKLVENGIFSLTQVKQKDYFNQNFKELSKRGLKDGTLIGDIADGTEFILEFKVDTLYQTIFISNPASYFRHNPDYQLFRRNYEITALLLAGFE